MITTYQFSKSQAQAIVQDCFADLVAATEAAPVTFGGTDRPDLAQAEQNGLSMERVRDLRGQLLNTTFDGSVAALSRETVVKHGGSWKEMTEGAKSDVMNGVARALLEQQRLFQFRLTDRLADFKPEDALFLQPVVPQPAAVSPSISRPAGVTVESAVGKYLEAGQRQWVPKTYRARVWQLGFFCQHVGRETPLPAVTIQHVRTFRDALRTLHKRHGKMRGASFTERQTPSVEHRIADKTASIIFDGFKAFMRWAKSVDGLIDVNPAEDIRFPVTKKTKGQKSRRSFGTAELRTLFTSPIYVGCQSIHRRYASGSRVIKDAKFWVPVLGYYTGARLGELIQLHIADVNLAGPIPFLSFTESAASGEKSMDKKHLKTAAAIRTVPLHPDVMELGFADFVGRRSRKVGKGRIRLFEEFPYGSDEQASTVASKWFARFMDATGLEDRTLVFHSFRHTAEDAFRDALQPQFLTDRVIGHSEGTTSSGYGDGVSLEVMYEGVKAMRLKVRVPALIAAARA